jgi:ATP-dependent exoDNAse (exonuclease V) beta subunit
MQRPSFSIYDLLRSSGKTYALSQEYLKIILTAHKTMPTEIFLPLFTNKAVHEMKSRIVGSLSDLQRMSLLKKQPT